MLGRARLVRALQAQDVTLDDTPLLALDDAIRQTPRDRRPSPVSMTISDPPVEFGGTVPTIDELEAQVHRWLRLTDRDVFRLMLAAVAGHRVRDDSPWLLIVGPPSSVKTELLRMLSRTAGTVRLSSLTARTFASGLDTPGGEPSLLNRLTGEILVLKDFTTVLELAHDERQGVLAQLREIHDGQYDKYWGTGKALHWEGHVGFLAGVTPVIDQHHAVMGLLGPRFLLLRLHYSEDERPEVARCQPPRVGDLGHGRDRPLLRGCARRPPRRHRWRSVLPSLLLRLRDELDACVLRISWPRLAGFEAGLQALRLPRGGPR